MDKFEKDRSFRMMENTLKMQVNLNDLRIALITKQQVCGSTSNQVAEF